MNRITVEEHPDYLFGKINYASILLEEGRAGKVPEVFGKELDLEALYPNRDAFHLREVLGFYQVCVRYYLAVDNQDKAEDCLALMNDIGPDEPETEEASFRWTSAMMEGAARRIEEENKRRRSVESHGYDKSIQTTEKPVFNHSEIGALYANDVRIDHGAVRKILERPRESLIKDLETVLEDSIRCFEYFRELDRQYEG